MPAKILLFNSLALSKSIYVATMVVPPKQFIDEANHVQKEFIWDNKRPKIKHCTLIGDYSKFYPLKFICINKLLDDDFHPWKSVANHLYQSLGGVSVFHSNLQLSASCSATVSGLPIFYQELIQLWHKICDTQPAQPSEILGQSVCNNRFIYTSVIQFSTTNSTAKVLKQCMILCVKTMNS